MKFLLLNLLENSPVHITKNNTLKRKAKIDSSRHTIIALKDAFPSIQVSEQKDSVSDGMYSFNGEVSDDYGLKNLNFVYTLIHEDGTKKTTQISSNFKLHFSTLF